MSDFLPFVVVGLTVGSAYGLAATGLVLTYKTSGIFNFAHGAIAALVAFGFYDLREKQGMPWPLALAVCLLVLCPLLGLGLERMTRRLVDAPVAIKVVATLGLLVGIQQLIILRYGATGLRMRPFLPTNTYRILGVNVGTDQLIVVAIALAGMGALTWLFAATASGRNMRAVVERPELLALTGTNPAKVRRFAWLIGTTFTGLSGILLSPNVGLDVSVLTLLIVQAFGAAAIGMFTSIPLTYIGGLVVGVGAALSTKYVASISWLSGIPASLPFIILFVVLAVSPRRWLVDFAAERKPRITDPRRLPRGVKAVAGGLLLVVLLRLPYAVGARLPVYTSALVYVLIFLSLALLLRTSGQVSLAQLAFAAVGGVASARLGVDAGLPWLLAVVLGALITVPVGAVLAIPAVRQSGLYLALATFGFAVLLERLLFSTNIMFGGTGSVVAPRPSFATGDIAYFYVVLAFVTAAVVFISALHRSRLGRLLRAMSDSPLALNSYGTSVTAIKVIVFCVSAFLAGLGGALLGPVTGTASPGNFASFASLLLVVYYVAVVGTEITASIGAAIALIVVPSYITSARANEYLPLLFGVFAAFVLPAMDSGVKVPPWLVRAASNARRRPGRHPAIARMTPPPQQEATWP